MIPVKTVQKGRCKSKKQKETFFVALQFAMINKYKYKYKGRYIDIRYDTYIPV